MVLSYPSFSFVQRIQAVACKLFFWSTQKLCQSIVTEVDLAIRTLLKEIDFVENTVLSI